MRPVTIAIVLVLLLPSAWLLWNTSDVPRFGELHDDSLYFVSAESLADGEGYRITSLPEEPAQTKYPPLYPLLLSVAWRLNPSFPENLNIAAWLSWLAMPASLFLLALLLPRMGLTEKRTWLVLALFATNFYTIFFSTQLLTELPFLALALGAMLLLEKALAAGDAKAALSPEKLAVLAGIVGGLAYLTRSAAIALLAAGVVYLWIQQQRKLAAIFAGSMLPFMLGWMAWVRMNQVPTEDPELFYYLDYFRYHLYMFSFSEAHIFLWKNLDGLLWGLGGLILPKLETSSFVKIVTQVLAVGAISGMIRMMRRREGWLYGLFALFSVGLLLIWHYPPNERFVLPLFPLMLAGLLLEGEHLFGLIGEGRRHKDRSQRIAATGIASVAAGFVLLLVGIQAWVQIVYLPQDAASYRAKRADRQSAYDWIRANTPADTTLLSKDDPVAYLYTGRHAMRRTIPTAMWYAEDHDGMVDWLTDITPFAEQHGFTVLDFAGVGGDLGLDDDDRVAIEKAIATSPELDKLFEQGSAAVYAIQPDGSKRSAAK